MRKKNLRKSEKYSQIRNPGANLGCSLAPRNPMRLLMVCVLKLYDVQLMKTRVVHARDAAGRYHLSAMGIDPPPPLVY